LAARGGSTTDSLAHRRKMNNRWGVCFILSLHSNYVLPILCRKDYLTPGHSHSQDDVRGLWPFALPSQARKPGTSQQLSLALGSLFGFGAGLKLAHRPRSFATRRWPARNWPSHFKLRPNQRDEESKEAVTPTRTSKVGRRDRQEGAPLVQGQPHQRKLVNLGAGTHAAVEFF
jgi:hypothetical protein